MNQGTNSQLDFSVLDGSLDDIEDLPGFLAFPTGAYHVKLDKGLVKKEINKHPAVEMAMTCVEVKELSNPEDAENAPKVGDICSTAFMLDNETGRGFLKIVLKAIGERCGTKNTAEILNASIGLEAIVVVKKTVDKEKGKEYANLTRFDPI